MGNNNNLNAEIVTKAKSIGPADAASSTCNAGDFFVNIHKILTCALVALSVSGCAHQAKAPLAEIPPVELNFLKKIDGLARSKSFVGNDPYEKFLGAAVADRISDHAPGSDTYTYLFHYKGKAPDEIWGASGGIDVENGKERRVNVSIDVNNRSFCVSDTSSGAFYGKPDQEYHSLVVYSQNKPAETGTLPTKTRVSPDEIHSMIYNLNNGITLTLVHVGGCINYITVVTAEKLP